MSRIWLYVVLLSVLPVIGSLFPSYYPFLDSLADIRIPLCIVSVVLCLPLFFSRKRLVAFGITALLVGLIFFSYATGGVKIADVDRSKPTFRLLQSNLRYDNATPSKLLALIQQYHPDIITVQEASPQWLSFFHENGLTTITCAPPNDPIGAVGIIFSKEFNERFTPENMASPQCYSVRSSRGFLLRVSLADNNYPGNKINVFSTHIAWPWPYGQNLMMDEIENLPAAVKSQLLASAHTTLVAGDFNSVTWSHTVKRMETLTHTHHLGQIGPTWLSFKLPNFLRPYLGLPIDQVLVSDNVKIVQAKRLESIGSDHLPVLVDFQLDN